MTMKHLLTTLLLFLSCATGMAQEVVLDFTQNWDKSGKNYTLGDYTVTASENNTSGVTFNIKSSDKGYYHVTLSKKDVYIQLPAFSFEVEKIEVVGNKDASQNPEINIFVSSTAVSTMAKGSANSDGSAKTNVFEIDESHQAAGTKYRVQMVNASSCQITYIKVYKKGAVAKTATTTTFENINVSVTEGETYTGQTATVTPTGVAGSLVYVSSDATVAAVSVDGTVTLGRFGTATITATFTPDDTDAYIASSASYTIIHKEKEKEDEGTPLEKTAVFNIEENKSSTLELTVGGVTMSFTVGSLNNKSSYSLHGYGSMTFTAPAGGYITSIVLDGLDLTKYASFPFGDNFKRNDKKATWTGKESSVTFTSSQGTAVTFTSVTVTVSFVGELTLQDGEDNAEKLLAATEGTKVYDVTVTRTLDTDGWYTLCLPFTIPATALGEETKVRAFDHIHDLTMFFTNSDTIKAGRAYLVYPGKKQENPTFQQVSITAPSPLAAEGDYTFVGTYSPIQLNASTDLFLGAGYQLCRPSETSGKLGGFRAYFKTPAGLAAKPALLVDGEILSINDVRDTSLAVGKVYTLQGQLVGTSTGGLPAGVYILNGRKIVVK